MLIVRRRGAVLVSVGAGIRRGFATRVVSHRLLCARLSLAERPQGFVDVADLRAVKHRLGEFVEDLPAGVVGRDGVVGLDLALDEQRREDLAGDEC